MGTEQTAGGASVFEYPDRAGYPDGTGTLDQGTYLRQPGDFLDLEFRETFMREDARDD